MNLKMAKWLQESLAIDHELEANKSLLAAAHFRLDDDQITHLQKISHELIDKKHNAQAQYIKAFKDSFKY